MVLVNLLLSFALADYFYSVRKLECKKNITEMKASFAAIKPQIAPYVASTPASEIRAKLSLGEREFIYISLVEPEMLVQKVPEAAVHTDCAKVHRAFLTRSNKKNLDGWSNCIEHNYGRTQPPEIYTFLKACYQKISN